MVAVGDVPLHAPVVLVKGDDPVLVNEAALQLVHRLVGDDDPGLLVEEVGPDQLRVDGGDLQLGPLVDAAQTMPFLTDRRVVVGRGLGGFTKKDQVVSLVDYLGDPLPSTSLVLVWEKAAPQSTSGAAPKSLLEAIAAAGGVVVDASAGRGKQATEWVRAELAAAPITLDRDAVALVTDHLGEDVAKLPGIVGTLTGAFGEGARLSAADVEPFLGEAGGVAPWDLTDAIDRGDVQGALAVLDRMMHGGGRHGLAVMATLQGHVTRLLALDGAGIGDERQAAALLGDKGASTFRAKKSLEQSRRLGPAKVAELVALLHQADLDLKGARAFAWPGGDDAVMQVLVARLASRGGRR